MAAHPGRLWYEKFGAGGGVVKESGLDDGDAARYGESKDGGGAICRRLVLFLVRPETAPPLEQAGTL